MTDPTSAQDPWIQPNPGQPTAPVPPATYQPPTAAYPQQPGAYPPPGGYAQPGAYPPPAGSPQQPVYQPGAAVPQAQPYTGPMYYDPSMTGQVPPPKKMSGGVKALLWVIPILVVLAAAGVGFALVGKPAAKNKAATSPSTPTTPTTAPATPTEEPTTPAASSDVDTFTMPKTALGLPKSTDPAFTSLVKPLQDSMEGSGTAVAAAYASHANPRNILIAMGIATPLTGQISEFQTGMAEGIGSALNGTNKRSYPAGAMGGSMWCEDANTSGLKVGICSVADNGGALVVIYFNHTAAQTAAAILQLRPTVEHKG